MKRIAAIACLALSSIVYAGLFTPRWSIKLQPVAADTAGNLHIVDKRPPEQTKFHTVDFAKLSYKSYLGDINTTPDRMAILAAKLNKAAASRPNATTVEVTRFEILQDRSGSACRGCATAAVSYTAAVGADSGHKPGDDTYMCSISAAIDGNAQSAEIETSYHSGPFDTNNSAASVTALQACVDGAIDQWVEKALPNSTDDHLKP